MPILRHKMFLTGKTLLFVKFLQETTSLRLAILQAAQGRVPQEQPISHIRLSTAYRRHRLELNHGRAEMKLLLKCPSRKKK